MFSKLLPKVLNLLTVCVSIWDYAVNERDNIVPTCLGRGLGLLDLWEFGVKKDNYCLLIKSKSICSPAGVDTC